MGNLDRRIEALERLYTTGDEPTLQAPDLEERRAALIASMDCANELAREEEAAAGDSRRLRALEDLERRMRERVERRRWGEF